MVNEYAEPPAQELETFLPGDNGNGKVKISPTPDEFIISWTNGVKTSDEYQITPKSDIEHHVHDSYCPFKERDNSHPTTDNETLTHLLKASLGSGILAMPVAFMYSGLVFGIFCTLLTALVCTHCSYVLVKCAHKLYKRTQKPTMTFSEVAETAFENGPKWGRKLAKTAKYTILYNLFFTYFGTCSVYTVIVAKNFQQVLEHYIGEQMDIRVLIAYLLIPLILLAWIPNLKYLAPVSMIANFFMAVGLAITMYYLCTMMPQNAVMERDWIAKDYMTIPAFFSITIFAMEAIGVVMPLENEMGTPQNLVGICGVLNKGMSGVTLVYILLGFLGYAAFGDATEQSITLNLPTEEIAAQIVKIFIGLAVFCTFGLQFYVCLDIGWNAIRDNFTKRPQLVNYTMRTVLVAAAVLLAIAVPTIGPFIGLIGAFCFSILGLLVPVAIETVTYWDEGFGKYNWMVWKNVVVVIFGLLALFFGTQSAVTDILALYSDSPAAAVTNSTLATTLLANATTPLPL